ncbi:hypothetical protein SAMN04488029_1501 [Reichenbachiella faecimaris]|uniref:Uncharacterized protein n=1 Tax=Reichenbachiella faecimaris TaxID=692418 RepID=A0A1W2GA09_REIFA|nr:hypothetical protein [Reichenbachiella faecimaris]SMD33136.1 hypothetical protein SAMN04488029_1501 [Reichenbachiella faecimaris]
MKRVLFTIGLLVALSAQAWAQCAMCKTTIVNNVSHGELSLAEGLNFGIMYLFFTPYLIIPIVGLLWYLTSKKNAKKKLKRGVIEL